MTKRVPPDVERLSAAAQALQTGDVRKSLQLCEQLAKDFPDNADVAHVFGLAARSAGQTTAALSHLKKAAALAPGHAVILSNLGLVFLETGDTENALRALTQAVTAKPDFPAAHANLGHARLRTGDLSGAESCYRSALQLNPGQADAISNLVQTLAGQSRLDELGVDLNHAALQNSPDVVTARGIVAMHDGRFGEAVSFFEDAISLSRETPALLNHLALAHAKLGDTDKALQLLHRVVEAAPNNAEPLINIADILKYSAPDNALPFAEKALALDPANANACDLLGFLHFMRGHHREAIECFDKTLQIDPTFMRASYHKAGAAFLEGDFGTAWSAYLKRYGPSGTDDSPFGDTLPGSINGSGPSGSVAVWTDQGLGDEILQLGLVRDLYAEGKASVLSTSPRLVPLAQRAFPDLRVLSHDQTRTMKGGNIYADSQSPAIGLGRIYRRSWDAFPSTPSYLQADPKMTNAVRDRYLSHGAGKPLIGVSWKSTNATFGSEKSLDLPYLFSFFRELECTWVNLQYGDVSEDIAAVKADILVDSDIDPLRDMDAFAAQVEAIDLVITTSNTTAHMAGALGKRALVLVPRRGPGWLWYWFDGRPDSPWYPSLTLFRQDHAGDWGPALAAAAQACREILV